MKTTLIIAGVIIYLIGYIKAYKAMKADAIENFGLKWTVGLRSFALFGALLSWLTYFSVLDRPAKW